jgi:hypothetical protein
MYVLVVLCISHYTHVILNSAYEYAAICGLGPSDVVPGTIHFTVDGGAGATAREHADPKFLQDYHNGRTDSISVDCIPIQSIFDMTGVQASGDVYSYFPVVPYV